jgi:hypothetical protein
MYKFNYGYEPLTDQSRELQFSLTKKHTVCMRSLEHMFVSVLCCGSKAGSLS